MVWSSMLLAKGSPCPSIPCCLILASSGGLGPTGVIRSLHNLGRLEHAFCTETRPYNQGARLTAFELVYEQIPATLIADSMAAAAMAHQGVSGQQAGAPVGRAPASRAGWILTPSVSFPSCCRGSGPRGCQWRHSQQGGHLPASHRSQAPWHPLLCGCP